MGYLTDLLYRVVGPNQVSDSMFPPSSTYVPERDMPDQSGKSAFFLFLLSSRPLTHSAHILTSAFVLTVAIVTGANTGVGFETAKALLLKGAKVYVGSRSEEKGVAAVEKLNELVKSKGATGRAVWLKLDLADLDSVKASAEEFKGKEKQLDLLFCNACVSFLLLLSSDLFILTLHSHSGVMVPALDQLTKQGFDLQWGASSVLLFLWFLSRLSFFPLTPFPDRRYECHRSLPLLGSSSSLFCPLFPCANPSLLAGPPRSSYFSLSPPTLPSPQL
jgi:hypothetical protein